MWRYEFLFFQSGLFLLLVITSGWAQTSGGQETGRAGQASLTLVNALPGPENLHVKFGQEDIWPAGFTPGQSTGAVLFPSGKKKVQLSCAGFAPTLEEISLPPGGNFGMVFFPGEKVKDGPDAGKKKIGVFCPPPILPDQLPQRKNWSVLLVGPLERMKVKINGQGTDLEQGKPVPWKGDGGRMVVECGERMLLASSPEGDGNYWVILMGENEESIQAVVLNHVMYDVPKDNKKSKGLEDSGLQR